MQVVNNRSKYQLRKSSSVKGKWLPKSDLQCNNLAVKLLVSQPWYFFQKLFYATYLEKKNVLMIEKKFPKC